MLWCNSDLNFTDIQDQVIVTSLITITIVKWYVMCLKCLSTFVPIAWPSLHLCHDQQWQSTLWPRSGWHAHWAIWLWGQDQIEPLRDTRCHQIREQEAVGGYCHYNYWSQNTCFIVSYSCTCVLCMSNRCQQMLMERMGGSPALLLMVCVFLLATSLDCRLPRVTWQVL